MRAHFDRVAQTDETSTWKGVACHWCGRGDDDRRGTGCRLDRAQVADRVRVAAKATSTSMRRELDALKQALWQMNSREQQMTEELRLSKEEAQSLAKQKCEQESDFNSRLKAAEYVRINDKAIDEALSRLCEEAPQPFVPLLEAITQCSPSLHVLSPVFQAFEEKLAACIAARDSLKEAHSHRGKEDRRLTAANRLEVDQTRDQREAASLNGPDHHHSPSQASLLPGTPAPTPSIPAVQISLVIPSGHAHGHRSGRFQSVGGGPSANPAVSQPPAVDSPAEPLVSSGEVRRDGTSSSVLSNRRVGVVALDAPTQARRARRGLFSGGVCSSACARRSSEGRLGSADARTPSSFGHTGMKTPRCVVRSEARGSASASLRLREIAMNSLPSHQGRSPSTASAFLGTSHVTGAADHSCSDVCGSVGTGSSGAGCGAEPAGAVLKSGLGRAPRNPSSRTKPVWQSSTSLGPWSAVLGALRAEGAKPTATASTSVGVASPTAGKPRGDTIKADGVPSCNGEISSSAANWPSQSPCASPRFGAPLPPPLPDRNPFGLSPPPMSRTTGAVRRPRAASRGVSTGRDS